MSSDITYSNKHTYPHKQYTHFPSWPSSHSEPGLISANQFGAVKEWGLERNLIYIVIMEMAKPCIAACAISEPWTI